MRYAENLSIDCGETSFGVREKVRFFENGEIEGARLFDACTASASALRHPDAAFVSLGS